MTKFDDIKTRLRALLEDNSEQRFSDDLLAAATRQTLEELEQRLPRLVSSPFTVTSSGRQQPILSISDCRYFLIVSAHGEGETTRELQPETRFTYLLLNGANTASRQYIPRGGG